MKDSTFLLTLKECNLLLRNVSTTLESLTKVTEKASYFLDNVIKFSLDAGGDTYFHRLLTIMTESGYEQAMDLAKKIKAALNVQSNLHQPSELQYSKM